MMLKTSFDGWKCGNEGYSFLPRYNALKRNNDPQIIVRPFEFLLLLLHVIAGYRFKLIVNIRVQNQVAHSVSVFAVLCIVYSEYTCTVQ